MEEMTFKTLPIVLQKDYNMTLGYALPLCILLADNKFEGWYYENYTMPYAILAGIDHFECGIFDALEYGSRDNINTRLIRYSYIGKNIMSQVTNIHVVIKERIQEEFYCILFLDYYYISEMNCYNREHFAHEILVYGYNDDCKEYNALTFVNENFESFMISYEEMELAYAQAFFYIDKRAGWNEKMFIQFRCVGHTKPYPISIDTFKDKMKNYMLPLLQNGDYYLHLLYMQEDSEITYGIKITDTFLNYVVLMKEHLAKAETDKEIAEIFTQYYPFHMFADFHKGLYKRFQFYGQNKLKQEDLEEYKIISKKAELIRMNFLKAHMLAGIENKNKILKILDSIEEKFIYIKDNEKLACEKINSLI